jgi:hypothetical protein
VQQLSLSQHAASHRQSPPTSQLQPSSVHLQSSQAQTVQHAQGLLTETLASPPNKAASAIEPAATPAVSKFMKLNITESPILIRKKRRSNQQLFAFLFG